MGYLKKGGKHCFSLVIYKFCGNKALYWAILLFTMFIGPAAVAQQVLQNRVCPSFSLSGCFLGIGSLVFFKFWHGARNWYLRLLLFWIKFQPVLLLKVSLIKICNDVYWENNFLLWVFVCLSRILFGNSFQIYIFKSWGFGENIKSELDHIGGCL